MFTGEGSRGGGRTSGRRIVREGERGDRAYIVEFSKEWRGVLNRRAWRDQAAKDRPRRGHRRASRYRPRADAPPAFPRAHARDLLEVTAYAPEHELPHCSGPGRSSMVVQRFLSTEQARESLQGRLPSRAAVPSSSVEPPAPAIPVEVLKSPRRNRRRSRRRNRRAGAVHRQGHRCDVGADGCRAAAAQAHCVIAGMIATQRLRASGAGGFAFSGSSGQSCLSDIVSTHLRPQSGGARAKTSRRSLVTATSCRFGARRCTTIGTAPSSTRGVVLIPKKSCRRDPTHGACPGSYVIAKRRTSWQLGPRRCEPIERPCVAGPHPEPRPPASRTGWSARFRQPACRCSSGEHLVDQRVVEQWELGSVVDERSLQAQLLERFAVPGLASKKARRALPCVQPRATRRQLARPAAWPSPSTRSSISITQRRLPTTRSRTGSKASCSVSVIASENRSNNHSGSIVHALRTTARRRVPSRRSSLRSAIT